MVGAISLSGGKTEMNKVIGGENLTNFKQKNPIIDAADPWGDRFDSTMIWGPVHGAKGYIGVRFNLARD